ncbi:Fic family protein [Pseudodesulfovibrio indicus]|uniref:Fic family protein n=2 Tax=Pseudodesulfovibrio indicus TaxID=1716143 RepID=A0AA94TIP5_9BACT|nr:Fic family protein [Pseudodesulfovibrio indicus]TDT82040.1 Fic family protein [Pseudodesulfovibrio indicus]
MKPIMPQGKELGPLKDLAQEVLTASAGLEGRVALETAQALGDQLRLINSFYSNLIEGHRTFIPDIEKALNNHYSDDDNCRYAQELCRAHVVAEKTLMEEVRLNPGMNVSSPEMLSRIHREFYSHLPPEHLFTHEENGFTDIEVRPGEFRDLEVAIHRDAGTHGPNYKNLPAHLKQYATEYDVARYHGDEKLIAMAAAHHQLTWLHPFRDGNGRVCRLHSGLFMARSDVNRGNLWSLSRGLSRSRQEYMINLFSVDPAPDDTPESLNERLADFCDFFLGVCLDQIQFMTKQLRLEKIEQRIEWFVRERSQRSTKLPLKASRLLRAAFMQGQIPRGQAPEILNTSETSSRRIVRQLLDEGLLTSESHRAPLKVAFSIHVMPYYFPSLYRPDILGPEYVEMLGSDLPDM